MTEWVQVLVSMADGPTQPVQGVVVPYRNSDEPFHFYSRSYGEEPVFLPLRRDGVRLYRWGRRSRIETTDGELLFVSDGTSAWNFISDPHRPRRTELQLVQAPGSGRALAITPPVTHWVGHHHARPIGPVADIEFLGRRCWSVELAPRVSRNMPEPSLRLIVDAASGAVVAQRSGDGVDGAEYTELTVGHPIDSKSFTWDGPVVTDEESRARAGRGGRPARRWEDAMDWFRETITPHPIQVPVLTDFTPRIVDLTDRQSGAFSAPLGKDDRVGWLIRRPRSTEPWAVKTYGYQICWSTESFDWACQIYHGVLDETGITTLQMHLHPEDAVVGAPQLVFVESGPG